MAVSINLLLERLAGVRGRNGQWMARCPAHDDHDPSLSIKLLDDGRILIHCFALCGAADILEAIGLSLSDLYPDGALASSIPKTWTPRQQEVEDAMATWYALTAARTCGAKLTAQEKQAEFDAWRLLRRVGAFDKRESRHG